jgi:hypothetical protein
MSSKNFRRKEPKKRIPVKKREMHDMRSQKTFRSLRRDLSVEAAEQEINEYLNGEQDG